MPYFICGTCGTQYPESSEPPTSCPICQDERQYIGLDGQQWTTLEDLRKIHQNQFHELETNLTAIGTSPKIGIGQHALLLQTPTMNILWDCITLIDDDTIARVRELGGVDLIVISHPHYYSTMIDWSETFDVPIIIHEDEKQWVMRPHENIQFWSGETRPLSDDLTLIRCGGHFSGGQVLHWSQGAAGQGVILAGDIIQVVPDTRWVSFMYSYPNQIPLSAKKVQKIVQAVEPYKFDRIYSPWWKRHVLSDAKAAVKRSAERYIKAIED